MDRDDDFAFLASILTGQTDEDPRARRIPRQRLAALARNPIGMTPSEMATLLVSPGTRTALAALRRAYALLPAANDDEFKEYVFRPASYAADDGSTGTMTMKASFGTLTVRPGPDAAVPYVLLLQLNASVPGGISARHVTTWETTSNQVWLDGLTDEEGMLLAPWPFGAAQPSDRLQPGNPLRFALAEEPEP